MGAILGAPFLRQTMRARAATPLEDGFDEIVTKHGFTDDGPGVAVLVREPRRVLLRRCRGQANLEDHAPITAQTMFELASVSKCMTGIAILQLAERKKLSLEDDVRKYIPELPVYDEEHPIRIIDLLHHVSGLPNDYMKFKDVPARNEDYWVNDDYVPEFAKQQEAFPLRFTPGKKYEYNNSNYMLLGVTIARVTKKTYGEHMREALFVPLGMKNTFVYESPKAAPKLPGRGYIRAVGYRKEDDEWKASWGAPPTRNEELLTVGDGGVWTNLEDMDAWDRAVVGGRLLKAATARLALAPSRTTDEHVNNYGCGWALYFDDEGQMKGFGHDGDWGGFRTSYYRYLLGGRTTVILSNRGNLDLDKFWDDLNDMLTEALKR
jgi:CubicO group peptidase (beta-lactamase class C family)